jgi:hypothetical protein
MPDQIYSYEQIAEGANSQKWVVLRSGEVGFLKTPNGPIPTGRVMFYDINKGYDYDVPYNQIAQMTNDKNQLVYPANLPQPKQQTAQTTQPTQQPQQDNFQPVSVWTKGYKGEGYQEKGTGKIYKPTGSTLTGLLLEEIPKQQPEQITYPAKTMWGMTVTYQQELPVWRSTSETGAMFGPRSNNFFDTSDTGELKSSAQIGDFVKSKTKDIGLLTLPVTYGAEAVYYGYHGVRSGISGIVSTAQGIPQDIMSLNFVGLSKRVMGFSPVVWIPSAMIGGAEKMDMGASPIGAVSYGLGEMAPWYAVGKVARKTPVALRSFEIPTAEGVKTWKGIGFEFKQTGKALVGITDTGIALGRPKWNIPKETIAEQYTPFSPIETSIAKRSISGFTDAELTRIESGTSLMKITETTKSKFKSDFTRDIETLSPKGVETVLKFARKQKAEVYGSFGAKTQMPKELGRTPADIDIQLRTTSPDLAGFQAKNLLRGLQLSGERVRISEQSPTLIESFKGGNWRHAVDIHSYGEDLGNLAEGGWGFKFNQKTIKIERIRTMRLSEQGLRKGVSSMGISKLGVYPEQHKFKDIGDFFNVQETLLRSREKSIFASGLKTARGRGFLTEFKGTYSEADLKKIGMQPTKILLYAPKSSRFSLPKSLPSMSIGKPFSKSVSLSPGRSFSASLSRSLSPSKSISRSVSLSPSKAFSKSLSPSKSFSKSLSASLSRSLSPSRSISKSLSPSKSMSYSPGPRSFYSFSKSMGSPGKKGRGLFSFKLPRQPKKYQPQLFSILTGLTSVKAPRTLTGLEIRPMIISKKRGRSRMVKKKKKR